MQNFITVVSGVSAPQIQKYDEFDVFWGWVTSFMFAFWVLATHNSKSHSFVPVKDVLLGGPSNSVKYN